MSSPPLLLQTGVTVVRQLISDSYFLVVKPSIQ
jgi:hypothetical protein